MTKISPRLLALLVALILVGACSSSSSDDDSAGAAEVKEFLVDSGFGEEGADCVIESLEDQDVDVDGLSEDDLNSPDLADAFGQAGADCVNEVSGDLENLPDEAFDLSNPVVYDQFVKQFSEGSGLSVEVSQCVADYLVDNDVDVSSFLSNPNNPDSDAAAAVQTAVENCQ